MYYPPNSFAAHPPPIPASTNALTRRIIGAAIEVHRHLGPGLLQSAYEGALCVQLASDRLQYLRQPECPVEFQGQLIGAYRLDLLVEGAVIIEIKSVAKIDRLHVPQVLTYLRAIACRVGLIINFNVPVLTRRSANRPLTSASATFVHPSCPWCLCGQRPCVTYPVGHPWGLKYSTIPAPAAARRNPTYKRGFGATFGGCVAIVYSTFTSGAKPKTIGIT